MITVTYDQEVDTTYIKFKEGRVDRTQTLKVDKADYLMLDFNNKDWLLGIEYAGKPTELLNFLHNASFDFSYAEIDRLLAYYI